MPTQHGLQHKNSKTATNMMQNAHTLVTYENTGLIKKGIKRLYLSVGNGAETLLLQLLNSFLVVSEIELGTDQDDGGVGAVMAYLR